MTDLPKTPENKAILSRMRTLIDDIPPIISDNCRLDGTRRHKEAKALLAARCSTPASIMASDDELTNGNLCDNGDFKGLADRYGDKS